MVSQTPKQTSGRSSLFFGVIFALYIVLSPLYIFSSGMPQPADYILVLGLAGMIATIIKTQKLATANIFIIGAGFVTYTATVNTINFFFHPDQRFLFAVMFYLYNFLVFTLVAFIFDRYTAQMQRWSYRALIFAIMGQFALIVLVGPEWGRAEGTFNNPNQLTYWSMLCAIMLVIIKKKDGLSWTDLALLIVVGYIQTQTLSKAGLIVYVLFMGGLMFTRLICRHDKTLIIVASLLASTVFLAQPGKLQSILETKTFERTIKRLETIGQETDDSLEGRGYDRIWRFPEYVVLGAGEGAYTRFTITGRNQELHSGIATLIFSYGLLGTILFSAFLFGIFNGRSWYLLLFLAVVMAYGVTHQNIRFTHFWIFLAISYMSPRFVSIAKPRKRLMIRGPANV